MKSTGKKLLPSITQSMVVIVGSSAGAETSYATDAKKVRRLTGAPDVLSRA